MADFIYDSVILRQKLEPSEEIFQGTKQFILLMQGILVK
jgi:hypothetical protein